MEFDRIKLADLCREYDLTPTEAAMLQHLRELRHDIDRDIDYAKYHLNLLIWNLDGEGECPLAPT